MSYESRIIKAFKLFVCEESNLKIDFRKHVFLSNQYGAYPQYDFHVAETILNCLFKFWDKYGVDYSDRYNYSMEIDALRITRLKEYLDSRLTIEIEEHIFNVVNAGVPVFEILSEEEYNADFNDCGRYLTQLGGCYDYGNDDDLGLGDWAYQFEVEVTNQFGKTRQFTIAYQPEERNNGMKAYSGYDIALACVYGYDADESSELAEFCDDDSTVLDALYKIAWSAAKKEYKRLIELFKEGEIEPNKDYQY